MDATAVRRDVAARLYALTARLGGTMTAQDVYEVLVTEGRQALGCDGAIAWALTPDQKHFELVAIDGYDASLPAALSRIAVDAGLPHAEVMQTGEMRRFASGDELVSAFPAIGEDARRWGATALLPIALHDTLFAIIQVVFRKPRSLDDDDRQLLTTLAGQCAQALARTKLLESERAARRQAEAARRRVALLDSLTKQLVTELDAPEATLTKLARIVVPALSDWCTIYVPRSDGGAEVVATAHEDAALAGRALDLLRKHPINPNLSWGVARALRTGESAHVHEMTDALLQELAFDAEHLATLRAAGIVSHLAVPLKAHGRILGCMALTQSQSARRFDADDRWLIEEIATRAALLLAQAELHAKAQAALAEAEEANRSKDMFLAMLGHELRNPLSPIVTALQLMKLRGDTGSAKEREVIERQVKHLVRLVDDLLDVSRITRGKIALQREPVDVGETIAKAIEMSSPLLEQHAHHLSVEVPPGLLVDGDAARLAQVFSNLLNNAAKYTPRGGHIRVDGRRDGDHVRVAVTDDGEGIEPQTLGRVFDLFEQGAQTLDRAQGGLGIGLSVVRSLVELHGGQVSAKSEGRGRGAELVVRLPALTAPTNTAARARPTTKPAPPLGGARVLIVDDNIDAAMLLGESLEELGYATRIAHDGPNALLASEKEAPDLALLDIGLPIMDGYELARRLREKYPSVRLVAITGYGQLADRERSRAAGFDAHIVKPLDLDVLAAILETNVRRDEPV